MGFYRKGYGRTVASQPSSWRHCSRGWRGFPPCWRCGRRGADSCRTRCCIRAAWALWEKYTFVRITNLRIFTETLTTSQLGLGVLPAS